MVLVVSDEKYGMLADSTSFAWNLVLECACVASARLFSPK